LWKGVSAVKVYLILERKGIDGYWHIKDVILSEDYARRESKNVANWVLGPLEIVEFEEEK
jgi:hypothetical protein